MKDPLSGHDEFAGFRLDRRQRELRDSAGALRPLTAKAFDTLCYLVDHRERVVGKDELIAAVWPGRVVEENNLAQAVSALRRALGDSTGETRCVVTIPGKGYRFVCELDVGGAATHAAAPSSSAPSPRSRVVWLRTVAALAIAGAVAVGYAWLARETPPEARAEATLAVLPFRSLGDGARDELLELGLAETVIATLSRSRTLRVRSLASASRALAENPDSLAAADRLGAAWVVEGSTQRVGERIRVNARLLSVPDGASLWAETLDTPAHAVFTLQDDIAAAVARTLALETGPRPRPALTGCDGANEEAYRAYLTGRYLVHRPQSARLLDALAAFERALALDPSCARAYAGIAHVHRALVITGDRDPREAFAAGRAAVDSALAVDPESAEAYASRAYIEFWFDWDFAAAQASLTRAIELNPSLPEAHFVHAHLLVNYGRFEQGLAQAERALELDPLSPLITTIHAGFLGAAGREADSKAQVARALELEPDFWVALLVRGGMALDRGDVAAAIADYRRAVERSGRNAQALGMLAVAEAAGGNASAARDVLHELETRDAAGYVPATSLAVVHLALGDRSRALDLLERARAERDVRIAFLGVDARWNALRDEPRFLALSDAVGLPAARASGRF